MQRRGVAAMANLSRLAVEMAAKSVSLASAAHQPESAARGMAQRCGISEKDNGRRSAAVKWRSVISWKSEISWLIVMAANINAK
jgi:hypothetical protein